MLLTLVALLGHLVGGVRLAAAADSQAASTGSGLTCDASVSETIYGGNSGYLEDGTCDSLGTDGSVPGLPVRVVDCGYGSPAENGAQKLCASGLPDCPPTLTDPAPHLFLTQIQVGTGWITTSAWCPGDQKPAPLADSLRAEALKLLTPVAIGTTAGGHGLVNFEQLYWAQTATGRDLGTVTLLGIPVRLRVTFVSATWNFGDGHTDTTASPGRPFVTGVCHASQCPMFYGHTYADTGIKTVTLAVTWAGEFQIAGGGWIAIPGALPGPTARTTVTICQARGVLLPPTGPIPSSSATTSAC